SLRRVPLMVRQPGGRPRLAEIAGTAAYGGGMQPDRRAGSEFEIDYRAGGIGGGLDRQQGQDAVLLAAVKAAIRHLADIVEGDAAQRPLERSLPRRGILPAEAVGHQPERPGGAIVGEIAHRDERVL